MQCLPCSRKLKSSCLVQRKLIGFSLTEKLISGDRLTNLINSWADHPGYAARGDDGGGTTCQRRHGVTQTEQPTFLRSSWSSNCTALGLLRIVSPGLSDARRCGLMSS